MRFLAWVFLAGAVGCTASATPPGVIAIYGAPDQTVLTPYPSDRYAVADSTRATGLRVQLQIAGGSPDLLFNPQVAATLDELNQHDGFSVSGGVIVSFSGAVDVTGLAPPPDGSRPPAPIADAAAFAGPGSPMVLLDVDPHSPERGKARGLVLRYWQQPADGYYHDEFTIIAQPDTPLRPRTRYLFALTGALRAADGGPVARSALMDDLLSGRASGAYADEIAAGLTALEAFGLARESVVLATAFTTMTVLQAELAAAGQVRALGAPKILSPWSVETPLTAPDKRIRLRAVYQAPVYVAPSDQRFRLDAQGDPVVQDHQGLEVFLAVSDATSAARRPVVIYQHGLGGSKDGSWGTAERLAPLDAAVFAIDSPHHGSRADDPKNPNALLSAFEFFGIDPTSHAFVIGRARDNFRQMALDQLGLIALIESLKDADLLPFGAPDGKPDFDVSRVLYIGHSFGSVQGATICALAPEISTAVWNVGGALLTDLLRDSATFALLIDALRPPGVSDGEIARFFSAIQAIVDPGDAVNYARYCVYDSGLGLPGWRGADVLLQEVIADAIVPNSTSEALARAAQLTLLDPIRPFSGIATASAPKATPAISQFDFIEGGKPATHGELIFSPEAIAQYRGFFQSALSGGRAVVPHAYPNGPEKPAQ